MDSHFIQNLIKT